MEFKKCVLGGGSFYKVSVQNFNCYYIKDANLLTNHWVCRFIEKKFYHQRANEAYLYDNREKFSVGKKRSCVYW